MKRVLRKFFVRFKARGVERFKILEGSKIQLTGPTRFMIFSFLVFVFVLCALQFKLDILLF